MTQQFVNCAQVEVTGPGGGKYKLHHYGLHILLHGIDISQGTPGPTTKFPGAYDPADKGKLQRPIYNYVTNEYIGIWLPRSMYNPYKPSDLLKNYKGPGPEIWTG